MSSDEDLATVLAWHAALNAGDVERLVALSSPEVTVGGPRGSGSGADLLRDWFGRAGIRLEPGQMHRRGDAVVVEQTAQWRTPDGGFTEPRTVASVFQLRQGLVASVIRYDSLAAALGGV